MPLTTIDPVAALVTIDLQKGIVSMNTAHNAGEVVARAARLAEAFRQRGLPVVLVNVESLPPGRNENKSARPPMAPDWSELVPELNPQPGDHRVTKKCPGAFLGSDLDAFLRGRGVTQIFLAGISTSFGVESTGRCAYDLGYNVVFVADAMTDLAAANHQHCVEKIFPRLGEVAAADEVLGRL